jgi:hypothetical protein
MSQEIIPPSLAKLVDRFAETFTQPSFVTFQHLILGWILCISKHTITGVLRASGALEHKHYTCFHRFFRLAVWSLESLSFHLTRLVLEYFPNDCVVHLAVDDTLCRHTGKRIDSAAMHLDPLLSTKTKKFYHFGHVWVVVAILWRLPFLNTVFALPIFVRLYRPKKLCQTHRYAFFTKPELASQMLQSLATAYPFRQFQVVADHAYSHRGFLTALPLQMQFIGRFQLNAALYELPPAGKNRGKKRVRGARLPSPEQLAKEPGGFQRLRIRVYGQRYTLKVKEYEGLASGKGGSRWLKLVVIVDWPNHKKADVLISTDTSQSARQIIGEYCLRWKLEVTFEEVKGKLGLEESQNWKAKAVERTAPLSLFLYTLIVLWYVSSGKLKSKPILLNMPWYSKTKPAFREMLAALRIEIWQERLKALASREPQVKDSLPLWLMALAFP